MALIDAAKVAAEAAARISHQSLFMGMESLIHVNESSTASSSLELFLACRSKPNSGYHSRW